ncbi:DUF1641 domain-containing protein [Fictibacillus phosphorivorans]|uniref:DUF1641 domain-containing protein n=1 Tax=Fictibacillus phosphorivorans TaxID=1221500 RepID=UPI0020424113|nr:DUF1641 domain-containing protein [Fictibacillus phosphorivorans]MCM3719336.1 DUF1641 domain-containing protein [Fictibacillus phosphorivorans]MCM3776957.1 DUF1641 domain-containing protein [Fictibacillus phosphorivorans]
MAKAIKNVHKLSVSEEEQRTKDLREVEDALIKNKQAIMQTLEIMNHMQDKGILSLLNGLFGQGDKVLDIAVKAMDKPENTNTIKNLLLLLGTLGMINVKQLEPFLLKIDAGIARVAEYKDTDEKTGYFDLVKSLKDPEINRAITILMQFLKGMGQDTEPFEKTVQDTPKKRTNQTKDKTLENNEKRS